MAAAARRARTGQSSPAARTSMTARLYYTGIFTGVLAVYIRTLSPGIAGGDSGELVAEACALGTAHPPGYPTYTLLTWLATRWVPGVSGPLETPAGRANALSAICGALAAALVAHCVRDLGSQETSQVSSMLGGLVAAGFFAFSPLVWQYSTSAEVFALNNLLCAAILLLTLRFMRTKERLDGYKGALVCGLALTNQHTSLLFQVPVAMYVLWSFSRPKEEPQAKRQSRKKERGTQRARKAKKPQMDVRPYATLVMSYLLGLLPYIYLPLAAYVKPVPGSWGHVTSVSGFFRHLARSDYGTFQLYSGRTDSNEGFWGRSGHMVQDMNEVQGLQGVVLTLSVLGTLSSLAQVGQTRSKSIVLLAMLLTYVGVFHSLANLPLDSPLLYGVHQRFWMQPFLVVCVFAGAAINEIPSIAATKVGRVAVEFISFAFAVWMVSLQITRNFTATDQSENYHFGNHSMNFLEGLEPDAIALINWDQMWTSVRYMQQCEGVRPDVTSINLSMMTYRWFHTKKELYPDIHFPGEFYTDERIRRVNPEKSSGFTMLEFAKLNIDTRLSRKEDEAAKKRPLYIGGTLNFRDDDFDALFELVPFGYAHKVVPRTQAPRVTEYWERVLKILQKYSRRQTMETLPNPTRWGPDTWESTIVRIYWDAVEAAAAHALDLAVRHIREEEGSKRRRSLRERERIFAILAETAFFLETAIETDPEPEASLFKNLGIAYMEIVKSNLETKSKMPTPPVRDGLSGILGNSTVEEWYNQTRHAPNWLDWCSQRFLTNWKDFLEHPKATSDPQYGTVKQIYSSLTQTMTRK